MNKDLLNNNDGLDYLKAIAILMVIALHVPLFAYDFINYPSLVNKIQYFCRLLSEGVPIFFVINDYLLLKKDNVNLKEHIKKIIKIIILIILWSIILIIFGSYISNGNLLELNIEYMIRHILTTNISSKYSGILWFLQSMVAIYLVYPIISYLYNNKYDTYKYLFNVLAIFTVGINILYIINNIVLTFSNITIFEDIITFINSFLPFNNTWYIFYFLLGGILLKHKDYIKFHKKLFIFLGIISMFLPFIYGYYMSIKQNLLFQEYLNSNSVFMLFIITGLFAIFDGFKAKQNIISKFIISVGKNTLGIYFTHFIFVLISYKIFDKSYFIGRIIAYIFVFFASYLLTIIFKRIPKIKYLFKF